MTILVILSFYSSGHYLVAAAISFTEVTMKIQVLQENLAHGLAIVSRAAKTNSTLPVLQNVLLAAEGGQLKLAATDLEVAITCQVGAKIEAEGAVTIPAKTLEDLVKTLPPEAVSLALDVETQTLHVRCGKSKTQIKGIDAQEFPPLPSAAGQEVVIAVGELKAAISQVTPSASDEESRPVLTGVYILVSGSQATLDAADGYRLTRKRIDLSSPVKQAVGAIIPARALEMLARILPDEGDPSTGSGQAVTIAISATQVFFKAGNVELVSQRIEGQYPNINDVIPKTHATRSTLATAAFLNACKQANIFAREGQGLVQLNVTSNNGAPGSLALLAQAEETGQIETVIEGANVEGGELMIGVNVRFLREILGTIKTPSVAMETNQPTTPIIFRPVGDDSLLHVLMPMHVQAAS